MSACNCMGPQRGEPLCPCQMRAVKIIDGRYVKIEDLGPAYTEDHNLTAFEYANKKLSKLREFLILDSQDPNSVFKKYYGAGS